MLAVSQLSVPLWSEVTPGGGEPRKYLQVRKEFSRIFCDPSNQATCDVPGEFNLRSTLIYSRLKSNGVGLTTHVIKLCYSLVRKTKYFHFHFTLFCVHLAVF